MPPKTRKVTKKKKQKKGLPVPRETRSRVKPPKTPQFVPNGYDSETSTDASDGEKVKRKRVKRMSKVPVPKKVLRVTQEQYDKALAFLEGPAVTRTDVLRCTDTTFTASAITGCTPEPFEYLMADNFMFQEMLNCLEQQDLDGFVGTAVGAFPTRKSGDIRSEMLLAACFALFYHPATDEEVFRKCLVALFNTTGSRLGRLSIDQILRMITSTYEFESDN